MNASFQVSSQWFQSLGKLASWQVGKLASWQGVFGSASSTLASSRRCFVGGVEARCMSADMLYLASTRSSHNTGSVG